jgi:hypothetical protein
MAKGCTICTHANCTEIDSLLDSGNQQKQVALQFGVSAHALSRHVRHGKNVAPDSLDVDEQLWLDRLDKAHRQAVRDGDIRGQQQIAATGLRVARQRKVEAEKAKAAKAATVAESDANKVSIGDLDSLVEVFSDPSTVPDPVDRSKVEFVLRKARGLLRPDAEAVFQKMWSDKDFCEALIDYARDWQPKPKEEAIEPVQPQETAVRAN